MRHEGIVSKLSLWQKCALLSGGTAFGTRAVASVGLPALQFADGPHGLRHQDEGSNHMGLGESLPATCFPTAVTLADTWDTELVGRVGAALGREAASQRVGVLLGPGINIKRSPLCGRNFEYFSEDPCLAGEMAAAYVAGVQSAGVGACVKHFAVNSQETRRQASDSELDERTLREIYLAAFERCVRKARPAAIMSSYNRVNGTYANENEHLLAEILRGEWGFEGAVVTDWGASNDHVAGVRAGSTLEMPACGLGSARELERAVEAGELDEAVVDARVDELVELVLSTREAVEEAPGYDELEHHQLAREAAAAGIVLLKNEAGAGGEPLLPLAPGTSVALVGDFAANPRYQGAGSSLVNCTQLDTLEGAISMSGLRLVGFEPGFDRAGATSDDSLAAAEVLASRADVVLCCLGLSEAAESEGLDRGSLALDEGQLALLACVAKANANVVVLLSSGGVVECDWEDQARAILYQGLGGQAGAMAALDVLLGRTNPSGRLAETWPRRLEDVPCADDFPADGAVAAYREGVYVGYRYYQTAGVEVAWPFGFGLSYTEFAYEGLEVAPDATSATLTVTNVGSRDGAEVVQVYVHKEGGEVFAPARELRGFAKVALAAGESRRVTIDLGERPLAYYNVRTGGWEVEGGAYEVCVGPSSAEVLLSATVEVVGTDAPNPYEGLEIESYRTGQVRHVGDDEFERLLGRSLPDGVVRLDRNLCLRDARRGLSPLFWLVAGVLGRASRRLGADGRPNLGPLFIYNMPLRAIAKSAGGLVSMGMVDALVREVRGWGLAGVAAAVAVWLAMGRAPGLAGVLALAWLAWFLLPLLGAFVVNAVRNARGEARLARDDGETRSAFALWCERHQGLWEFIKFNVLSNISTATRFVCTWAGTAVFVGALGMTQPFSFLFFDYTAASSGGLGAFVTFLIAEVAAQVVNFFVQMKWVFKSTADFGRAAPKFALLAVLIVVVNLVLPGHVSNFCQTTFGMEAGLSNTIASAVNTLLAVIVSFPVLKFWITPDTPSDGGGADTGGDGEA